jgi:carbonic anhydrase
MTDKAATALAELKAGNLRFVQGVQRRGTFISQAQRRELIDGQSPSAVILGCSDSRAPVELIFDQGLGDLFVIRVAGNIVAHSGIGSVEFAAERFGTRLVVVLGHSRCGAVQATLEAMQQPPEQISRNLQFIVDRIRPNLMKEFTLPDAVRANVRASVAALQHGSAILEELVANDGLVIVGAEYSLETGKVDFFDLPVAH